MAIFRRSLLTELRYSLTVNQPFLPCLISHWQPFYSHRICSRLLICYKVLFLFLNYVINLFISLYLWSTFYQDVSSLEEYILKRDIVHLRTYIFHWLNKLFCNSQTSSWHCCDYFAWQWIQICEAGEDRLIGDQIYTCILDTWDSLLKRVMHRRLSFPALIYQQTKSFPRAEHRYRPPVAQPQRWAGS